MKTYKIYSVFLLVLLLSISSFISAGEREGGLDYQEYSHFRVITISDESGIQRNDHFSLDRTRSSLEESKFQEQQEGYFFADWHSENLRFLDQIDNEVNDRQNAEGLNQASESSMNLATFSICVYYDSSDEEEQPMKFVNFGQGSAHPIIFLSKGQFSREIENRIARVERFGRPKVLSRIESDVPGNEFSYRRDFLEFFALDLQAQEEDEGELNFSEASNLKMNSLIMHVAWKIFSENNHKYYRGKGKRIYIPSPLHLLKTKISSIGETQDIEDRDIRSIYQLLDLSNQEDRYSWLTADKLFSFQENLFLREFVHSEQVLRRFLMYEASTNYGIFSMFKSFVTDVEETLLKLLDLEKWMSEIEAQGVLSSLIKGTLDRIQPSINEINQRISEGEMGDYSSEIPWYQLLPDGNANSKIKSISLDIATHRHMCPVCASTYFYDLKEKKQIAGAIAKALQDSVISKRVKESGLMEDYEGWFGEMNRFLSEEPLDLESLRKSLEDYNFYEKKRGFLEKIYKMETCILNGTLNNEFLESKGYDDIGSLEEALLGSSQEELKNLVRNFRGKPRKFMNKYRTAIQTPIKVYVSSLRE